MVSSRLRNVLLIAFGAASLAACNEGYGYGGMSVGYGAPVYGPGYCDSWWDDCYGGYGYGYYGDPWWGWWGDYYYPGIGFYVYDRGGHRHRWNDDQRRHWEGRRGAFPHRNWNDPHWQNWNGFHGQGTMGNRNWNGGNRNWSGGSHNWSGGNRGGTGGGHNWSGGGHSWSGGTGHRGH